jgi:hypothetical protein
MHLVKHNGKKSCSGVSHTCHGVQHTLQQCIYDTAHDCHCQLLLLLLLLDVARLAVCLGSYHFVQCCKPQLTCAPCSVYPCMRVVHHTAQRRAYIGISASNYAYCLRAIEYDATQSDRMSKLQCDNCRVARYNCGQVPLHEPFILT